MGFVTNVTTTDSDICCCSVVTNVTILVSQTGVRSVHFAYHFPSNENISMVIAPAGHRSEQSAQRMQRALRRNRRVPGSRSIFSPARPAGTAANHAMKRPTSLLAVLADEEAARDSVFDEVVASGIHTVAMWRQLDHQVAADMHGSAVSPRTTSVSRAQSALAPLCGRARPVSTSACRARTRSGAAASTATSYSISATRSSSNASAPIWYHAADRPGH